MRITHIKGGTAYILSRRDKTITNNLGGKLTLCFACRWSGTSCADCRFGLSPESGQDNFKLNKNMWKIASKYRI